MKIKMTNASIIEILKTLNKFSNVSGKVGYAISRTKNSMMREIKPFEEVRDNLIKKYGEQTQDGFGINQDSENFKKFIDEIAPISEIFVEVEVYQVTQEEFDKCDCYSENAVVKDYDVLEMILIEKKENNDETDDNSAETAEEEKEDSAD